MNVRRAPSGQRKKEPNGARAGGASQLGNRFVGRAPGKHAIRVIPAEPGARTGRLRRHGRGNAHAAGHRPTGVSTDRRAHPLSFGSWHNITL